MPGYDPKVQQDFADLLILRAKRIVPVFTAMAAIVGAGVGVAVARGMGKADTMSVIIWAFIVGVFGFVTGKERSFSLRMKAQELLCQKKIEENTRSAEAPKSSGVSA
jgi:hypothetical protein